MVAVARRILLRSDKWRGWRTVDGEAPVARLLAVWVRAGPLCSCAAQCEVSVGSLPFYLPPLPFGRPTLSEAPHLPPSLYSLSSSPYPLPHGPFIRIRPRPYSIPPSSMLFAGGAGKKDEKKEKEKKDDKPAGPGKTTRVFISLWGHFY